MLFEQIVGTLNEVHGASVEKMRAEVEASCGDHCSQLAAQRAQLEKARDELHDGNAKMLHNAAIEELRSTIAEKYELCTYVHVYVYVYIYREGENFFFLLVQ